MPGTGFEPAHLAAPPPEDGASTNFATRALNKEQAAANIIAFIQPSNYNLLYRFRPTFPILKNYRLQTLHPHRRSQ